MRQKDGLSLFLSTLVLGTVLICSPAATPEEARHHAEHLQGSAGHTENRDACEDDQPVLTTALQRAGLPGRSEGASSSSQEAGRLQEIGGQVLGMAMDLPAFLPGSPCLLKPPAKLYTLHRSYLI